MEVDYTIVIDGHKPLEFKNAMCFHALSCMKDIVSWEFKDRTDLLFSTDPNEKKRTLITKIIYKPIISKILTNDEVYTYFKYLYNHRIWGKYILNKSLESMLRVGVHIRADIQSEHLLMLLTLVRYLYEYPRIVKGWCSYIEEFKDINKDLLLCISNIFIIEDKVISQDDVGFLLNHTLLSCRRITVGNILRYSSNLFPYKDDKGMFNDKLIASGINEYLKNNNEKIKVSDVSLTYFKNKMIRLYELDRLSFYSELYKLNEGVNKLNVK